MTQKISTEAMIAYLVDHVGIPKAELSDLIEELQRWRGYDRREAVLSIMRKYRNPQTMLFVRE
jgi:hypothetical protein